MKRYHTLLVRERGSNNKWSPEFGDYDLAVVKQEMADQKYSDYARIYEFKIITTSDQQRDIISAAAALK